MTTNETALREAAIKAVAQIEMDREGYPLSRTQQEIYDDAAEMVDAVFALQSPSQPVAALAEIASMLALHKLGGPWAQYRQEMPFAADCGCGETFFAKSEGDARSAWETHIAHYLTLPHKEDATPAPQDEGMVLLPRVMTAAMINAWSGGLTVSSDENAGRTTFQDAWQRVIEAATPATTTTERGRG